DGAVAWFASRVSGSLRRWSTAGVSGRLRILRTVLIAPLLASNLAFAPGIPNAATATPASRSAVGKPTRRGNSPKCLPIQPRPQRRCRSTRGRARSAAHGRELGPSPFLATLFASCDTDGSAAGGVDSGTVAHGVGEARRGFHHRE